MKKYFFSVKAWLILACIAVVLVIALIAGSNYYIIRQTSGRIYTDWNQVPANDVGLVLGTSQYMRNGSDNLFFHYRMDAAAELYHKGKIRHIIVSGDNHVLSYNEAYAMMKALIERGVPKNKITCDYAGFRTLDSVVRCKEVFGQRNVTIISQEFHLQRALFIADHYRMNTVGFAAGEVTFRQSPATRYREYFAKCKAVLDLFVLNKKPKFLGEPVKINI